MLIEIPLIGTDEGIPALECFRIRPPSAEIESAFVLRNAQLQIQGERNHAKLVLTSASVLREPVVEFGLAVGCGFALSKDYLLLTAEPSKVTLPSPPSKLPALISGESSSKLTDTDTPKTQQPVQPASSAATPQTGGSDFTLAQLARQRYPLQPKAREKFVRMMLQANPDLRQIDVPIAAGTELQVPPGLPVRRYGAYRPAHKIAVPPDQATTRTVATAPKTTAAKEPSAASAKSHQDMLVLGAPRQRPNAAELLSEAERLTAILIEQTNAQNAATEKITQLEETLNTLKKNVSGFENRIHAIELERQAEKLAPKPASIDFVELFLAVLVGGATGGLTLHFFNRMKSRKEHDLKKSRGDSNPQATAASPLPLKAQQSDGLPWQKGYVPVRQATSPEIEALPETGKEHQPQLLPESGSESAQQPATLQNDFDFVSKA